MERESKGPTKQQKAQREERAIHKPKFNSFDKQDHPRSPRARTFGKKNPADYAFLLSGFISTSVSNATIVLILGQSVFSYSVRSLPKRNNEKAGFEKQTQSPND